LAWTTAGKSGDLFSGEQISRLCRHCQGAELAKRIKHDKVVHIRLMRFEPHRILLQFVLSVSNISVPLPMSKESGNLHRDVQAGRLLLSLMQSFA
jgi:hypothetical protein